MADWLLDEIADGLQRLYALSLPRAPAGAVMPLTAAAWREAITTNAAFDASLDRWRFKAAFRVLCKESREWPSPRRLLDALPSRLPQKRLAPPKGDPAVARRALDEMAAVLGVNRVEPKPEAEPKPGGGNLPLREIEADLKRHYDHKRAAAHDRENDDG